MYLLDTVVLSELRKKQRHPGVVAWIASVPAGDLFLSAITVAEVEMGIERQRTANPDFAAELGEWLEIVLTTYGNRVLPVDIPVARRWGRLAARIGNRGNDLAIAATALEHGLTAVTRNVSDFAATGVKTLDPFRHPSRKKPG